MPTGFIPKTAEDTSQAAAWLLWQPLPSCPRLLGQAGQRDKLRAPASPASSVPTLPVSVAAPTAVTMWSGHTFVCRSWSLTANQTLLLLSSFPSPGLFSIQFNGACEQSLSSQDVSHLVLSSSPMTSPLKDRNTFSPLAGEEAGTQSRLKVRCSKVHGVRVSVMA